MNAHYINQHLHERFGGQGELPNFRIARTAEQLEYVRIASNIVEQRRRYSYLPRDYWVLERLMKVDGANAQILVGRFSYEPIFVFRNQKTDEPIPFGEEIIMSMVHSLLFKQEAKTKRDWKQEEIDFYNKQVDRALEFIQDECSPMSMQLHFGEAVVKGESKQ